MKNRTRNKILSLAMTAALLLAGLPFTAAADGCAHVHDIDCGYTEGAECGYDHTHDENCGYDAGSGCADDAGEF